MDRTCFLFGSIVSLAVIVQTAAGIETARQAEALRTLQRSFPGAKANTAGNLVLSVYGKAMETGATPEAAAAQFRSSHALVFGVSPDELQSGLTRRGGRQSQPVFYEADSDRFKFTLFYYSQFMDDIPVFRAELRVLVRNESPFPVVLANSSLRPLGTFVLAGRAAQADPAAGIDSVKRVAPHLDRVTEHGLVIWAGVDEQLAEPRLAYRIEAENDNSESWLYLVDARTGEILYSEDRIQHVDVTGSVIGKGTGDAKADICSNDVRLIMPHSRVNIGATTVFADQGGGFTIPNAGDTDVTVDSTIRGEWFRVIHFTGANEQLSMTVTPPGPANFVHNGTNTEAVRAQINGYVGANIVRDHMLTYNPVYPTLNATDMPVYVNRTDGFCPGNAWWSSSDLSINFCLSGGSNPNTAFGSVIYHEYGHHVVFAAGSGQGQYGEGLGDVLSIIITDDPGLGYGFSGFCGSTLRNAVNGIQYPCTAEVHACAGLLSGAVWETRNELVITEPADYRDIISNLSVNAILLHTGSNITPQIAIDFLTLDDDDADLENGAPHWNEICAGFGEHNLTCPPLVLIEFEYPGGLPEVVSPGAATTVRVDVVANIVAPIETTGSVSYRIGDTGPFTTDPMTEIAPNQYEAVLPAGQCGDEIQFFFTAMADSSGGVDVNDPINSPTSLYSSIAGTAIIPVAAFDFQSTTGWTVSGNATDGQWNAGVPVAGNRGDPPNDF
ncbi:MAG: PepSY domain-containing protein, partial [Planctomycetes bacterium]|nr:PepSY domain-containing protein [Planctomycetota bacterium]